MNAFIARKGIPAVVAMLCGVSALAETIMYNGYSRGDDATYMRGFTTSSSYGSMRPTGVGNMMKNTVKYSTLSFPACFDDFSDILPLKGGEDDASLYIGDSATGGAFSGTASGAKLLKLSDNCQSRTGSLHFRVLMRAEQGVLDALTSGSAYPTVNNSQMCGLLWTVPDYFQGCGDNSGLRLNGGLNLSAANNIANSGIQLNFVRGLAFAFYKDASGVSLRLFVWGSETAALASAQSISLVDNVAADETYVCYAKIDIGAGDRADVIRGMAQPVSTYDRSAAWPGSPFPRALRSNLIGGTDVSGLNANLVVMGANKLVGKMQIDEVCLTTSVDEAVVFDAAKVDTGVVLAYDGFPCGEGAYSDSKVNVRSMSALSTPSVYGFANSKWEMNIAKDAPKLFGAGNGLSFPSVYASQGIAAMEGTSMGFEVNTKQPLMMYRTLTDGMLDLPVGETVNMRFLMSVTPAALASLATGPDVSGTLSEGVAGVQMNVNYAGAGLLALPATKIETNNTGAPALCPRDNSCLFAFVKGSDGKVGLYLNLRSRTDLEQVSYKLADVDAAVGGTYLCFVTIEVGTGANGAEKLRAFGVNVADVTEQRIEKWVPSDAGNTSAVECELISGSSYPKHLAVGGSECSSSFKFDEFALSTGGWYPLVWAKYPRRGLALIFR